MTVFGQPVSWDAAYRSGHMPVFRQGRPVFNADGSQRMITRPILTREGQQWKDDVLTQVRAAKPSRWLPTAPVRVEVELFLSHDMDCDNATKLLLDAAAKAVGCDDILFHPCYQPKQLVPARDARVVLTFDDDLTRHR